MRMVAPGDECTRKANTTGADTAVDECRCLNRKKPTNSVAARAAAITASGSCSELFGLAGLVAEVVLPSRTDAGSSRGGAAGVSAAGLGGAEALALSEDEGESSTVSGE